MGSGNYIKTIQYLNSQYEKTGNLYLVHPIKSISINTYQINQCNYWHVYLDVNVSNMMVNEGVNCYKNQFHQGITFSKVIIC